MRNSARLAAAWLGLATRGHPLLVAKSTPKQKGVADEDDAAGESPDARGPVGGSAVLERTEQEEKPEPDLHHSEQNARAGTLTLEFVACAEPAQDVRNSREQDHDPEQREKHRLSNNVVDSLVEEHDDAGDDAGAARHERDASRPLAAEGCADADDSGKRPERPHVGREVVARLLRLNDHRSAERKGENASSEADPVGNVASRRSGAHGDLAAAVW